MPEGVKSAFTDVIRIHGNMTTEQATLYLEEMLKNKRYQQETWS